MLIGDGLLYGVILGILVVALLAIGAVWAIRRGGIRGRVHISKKSAPNQLEAFNILKGQYARGEIDKEEYERRKKQLAA